VFLVGLLMGKELSIKHRVSPLTTEATLSTEIPELLPSRHSVPRLSSFSPKEPKQSHLSKLYLSEAPYIFIAYLKDLAHWSLESRVRAYKRTQPLWLSFTGVFRHSPLAEGLLFCYASRLRPSPI